MKELRRISSTYGIIRLIFIILFILSAFAVSFRPLPEPKEKSMPAVKPILDQKLRDPSICTGPEGTYYLTGTSANNPAGSNDTTGWWYKNEGIRIWKSTDLKNREPLGLVWSLDKDATWAKAFKKGKWMSTIFGSDNFCILSETPGILPIRLSPDARFRPLMKTQK